MFLVQYYFNIFQTDTRSIKLHERINYFLTTKTTSHHIYFNLQARRLLFHNKCLYLVSQLLIVVKIIKWLF